MSTSKLLNSITIKEPCSADWDEMKGNDRARFCEHCSIEVTDLSRFTQADAVRLVLRSKGRLCLRIHRTPKGEVITREVAQQIHTISRRASRIAAGAFTAVISLSAAGFPTSASANLADSDRPAAHSVLTKDPGSGSFWLGGRVMDANEAVIPSAKVTLRNEKSNETQETVTGEDGTFGFWVDHAGLWAVTAEAPNFAKSTIINIDLDTAGQTQFDLVLQPNIVEGGVVVVAMEFESPLIKATYDDDLETVTALIRGGTPVNQAEEDGTTALSVAVGHGNMAMVRLLLGAGADARSTNDAGNNVLFWVDQENSVEILGLLIRHGANVNQVNENGSTPLIAAAEGNDGEFIQALLEAGAFVDAQNREGTSPLMNAAENGNDDAVKLLLKAGANFSLRNAEGKDALQLAIESEHDEIAELLRAAGAVDRPK